MSWFSDFVLAEVDQAKKIAAAINKDGTPLKKWPGFSWKMISNLDLANLYGFLTKRTSVKAVVDLSEEFESLLLKKSLTLESFPPPLVDLLAALPDRRLPALARKWSQTEEFGGRWDVASVTELLQQLRSLAIRAKAEGKPMLLCTSGF